MASRNRLGSKIVAVGRNYILHAAELHNPVPSKPVIFLKPTSSYVREGSPIEIPHICSELHHEGVVIGKSGKNIARKDVFDHIAGYVATLDMTARDIQQTAKKKGLPWSVAKGYDTFAPVSDFVDKARIPDPQNVELWCKVNGILKQKGNTKDMLWGIRSLVSYISTIFTLECGDMICTGTPEGVGPVKPGDTISAGISGIVDMQFSVIVKPTLNNPDICDGSPD